MSNQQARAMLGQIEDMWSCLDELFVAAEAEGSWNTKHGEDWSFADVPYHLMYFDRDVVSVPIERGKNVPADQQKVQRSIHELNEWNRVQFGLRPVAMTPLEAVEAWRAMRNRVRAAISTLEDERLMEPVWIPLAGCGWVPGIAAVLACLAHSWSEFIQLRFLMGRSTPAPKPETEHSAIAFFADFMPTFLDREAAKDTHLVVVMNYTGPGGGSWTYRIEDGQCQASEGAAADADLVITQSAETSELVRQKKIDFVAAMQSGDIAVEGIENVETFGRLFPEPVLDAEIPPMGPPQTAMAQA